MTDNHPITPPPEMVEQWECEYHHMTYGPDLSMFISEKAARWGADQELEACCEWLVHNYNYPEAASPLRAARRPEPPSLREQALAALEQVDGWAVANTSHLTIHNDLVAGVYTIRRALESLPD